LDQIKVTIPDFNFSSKQKKLKMQEFCITSVIITIDFSKSVCYNEIEKSQVLYKKLRKGF